MKILLIVPYFAPAWSFGGPVKVVYDLSKELIRQGHEVTVATTDVFTAKQRHNKKTDTLEGIRVVYFKNISNLLAYKANFYYPWGFRRWLKENVRNYDIIHCHDVFTWLNVAVSDIASLYGVPFIIQPHGSLNEIRMSTHKMVIKALFLNKYPKILKSCSAIIALTEAEKNNEIKRLSKFFFDKTYVVPNGLKSSQLKQPSPIVKLRLELGLKNREKMIIYVGRVQFIKGLDISIKALSMINDIPFKLVVIGRDEGMVNSLKLLADKLGFTDRIIFLGPIFGKTLAEYFSTADLFVLNSRSEGLPMAVLDACAAGLPVVISSHCNIPEVELYGAGIVVKNNTSEDTARAFREYFSNPQKQAIMREGCHKMIVNHFNLEKISKQYESIYSQFVDHSRAI